MNNSKIKYYFVLGWVRPKELHKKDICLFFPNYALVYRAFIRELLLFDLRIIIDNKFLKLIIKNKTCKNTRQKTILMEGRSDNCPKKSHLIFFNLKNKLLDSYTHMQGGIV